MKSRNLKFAFLIAALFLGMGSAQAQELPESGPDIRLESDDNLDDLALACDIENIQNDEVAASAITRSPVKMKKKSSCHKLIEADRKFDHEIRQAKCESYETYIPTERAIKNCQLKLRKSTLENLNEDIEHRDVCILRLQSHFCDVKTKYSYNF